MFWSDQYVFITNKFLYSIGSVGNGVVQLYRNGVTSPSFYYGIVQIHINSGWGNICDDSQYNQYEADVICHQLGYTGASSYSRSGSRRYIIIIYLCTLDLM